MKRKTTQGKREIRNRKSKKGTVTDLEVKGVRGGGVKGGAKVDLEYKPQTWREVLRDQ